MIAQAFQQGSFDSNGVSFGSTRYGDLAATVAAVLLDPEARDIRLDADPTHGAFKEPLIKVIGLLRSMEVELRDNEPWLEFGTSLGDKIGQNSQTKQMQAALSLLACAWAGLTRAAQ